MARTSWTLLVCGIASLLPHASADFGFTSPGFEYVQLSSPVPLAWNGQSGQVSLRAMVYPADDVESYIPIAANLSGTSYTWIPAALATGSKWTLEALDSSGQVTSSGNPFTVQGGGSANSNANVDSSSLMQQNPKNAVQSTTLATSASATPTAQITSTSSPSPTTTNPPMPSPKGEDAIPMHVRVAIWLGAVLGVAVIITVVACLFFRYRWAKGQQVKWRPFTNKKTSTLVSEIDGNESKISINRSVMELQGSDVPGSIDTSMGKRVELG